MNDEQQLWAPLCIETGGPVRTMSMRLVRKRGEPFLLLPLNSRAAVRVLELYPAQTARARIARTVLAGALAAGLPLGSSKVEASFCPDSRFVQFLCGLAGTTPGNLPSLGVLAGNPNSPGQRLIFMLLDNRGNPVSIVKAGLTPRAQDLVDHEIKFLESAPKGLAGMPALRGSFTGPPVRAMALDWFPGRSPRTTDAATLPGLLSAWVLRDERILVCETRAWTELKAACGPDPIFQSASRRLETRSVARAIVHGDFAPWNIRVAPDGTWTVLDWERGDLHGIPGWDWFHYVLQPAILVARLPANALAERMEQLLASPEFQRYSNAAGIDGCEQACALLYLLHCVHVIRPSEGLSQTNELLKLLAARWPGPE